MVKSNTLKTNSFSIFAFILLFISILILPLVAEHPSSAACTRNVSGAACSDSTTFNVGVNEILTVSINRPSSWAKGGINAFLVNKVGVSVISNNPAGFDASMKSSAAVPNLVNQADDKSVIPTLTSTATIDDGSDSTNRFPANKWGYSVVNSGASDPLEYYAMSGKGGTPITIANTTTASGPVSKDVYFAAKADGTLAAGTYANEVIITVVAGVVDATNPVTPSDDIIANDGTGTEVAKGDTPHGTVVETTTDDDGTTVTESYAKPAGATERTVASINEGTPLAIGLAITAAVTAAAGIIFFIIAKRRRDDDEEENERTTDY